MSGRIATTQMSVNPVTDVAVISITNLDETGAVNSLLSGIFSSGAEVLAERELATNAREGVDLYALLLPYRARVLVINPAPQVVAPPNVHFSLNLFHNPTAIDPTLQAGKYLIALALFDYQTTYQMLSRQDQIARTLDQFLAGIPLAPGVSQDWFRAVLGAQEFTLSDVKLENDSKAVITVKVTRPDLALWERTIDATTDSNSGPDQAARTNLSANGFPKVTYDDNIVVVKEAGDWKILCDFPGKERIEERHKEGIQAYHQHDYDKAITAYQAAISEADRDQASGNAGIKFSLEKELDHLKNVKAQISEGDAYIPKVALSDVDMKMAESRVPGIFGKLTNKGNKAIDEVVVTVTYLEGSGKEKKQVFSEQHSIVVTPIEFVNFSRPVLPFVPGETRSFGFKLIAPSVIQNSAKVDLDVSSIAFTQSTAPLPKPPPP